MISNEQHDRSKDIQLSIQNQSQPFIVFSRCQVMICIVHGEILHVFGESFERLETRRQATVSEAAETVAWSQVFQSCDWNLQEIL